jgi:Fe2+ transport system protein B
MYDGDLKLEKLQGKTILIMGNLKSGKTSLFNHLTGQGVKIVRGL